MFKTEYYETAVQQGFYGVERSGLYGKKDNVRKYWEDVFIKLSIRPVLQEVLERKGRVRILDLGCGSGEGLELLTHIPPDNLSNETQKDFILSNPEIELYKGIDISTSMIEQGNKNYPDLTNVQFEKADLSEGLPCLNDSPYDIYFSSYCSLSHLTHQELEQLTQQIFTHISGPAYLVFDVHGRFSPEWPIYWGESHRNQLPYNMGYLLPISEQIPEKVENFNVTYWSGQELETLIQKMARISKKSIRIVTMLDRSILVGRHMDTCFFKQFRFSFRMQVNRLFDRDFRGEVEKLDNNLTYLNDLINIQPKAWQKIHGYYNQWKTIVNMLSLLTTSSSDKVKKLIESQSGLIKKELKMLEWLFYNRKRFPVMDFWASIMGPQIACVLRKLEMNMPQGLGCGHSLFCLVKIN